MCFLKENSKNVKVSAMQQNKYEEEVREDNMDPVSVT